MADNAIHISLKTKFAEEVGELENVLEELKDWRLNAKNQILNLVDPSLFCGVLGRTKRLSEPGAYPESFKDPAEQMTATMFSAFGSLSEEHGRSQGSQWLPSDFQVRADGSVRILSYINNLHPAHHAAMYTSIEEIFSRFVPMLERLLSSRRKQFHLVTSDFKTPAEEDFPEVRASFPETSSFEVPYNNSTYEIPTNTPVILAGRTLQVIVKIEEIVLTPDAPTYEGGSWHIEDTIAEHINIVGVYYFGCENIKSSRLAFRVDVREPLYYEGFCRPLDPIREGIAAMYGIHHGQELAQTLEAVDAIADRCLVFPNDVQRRVEPFELDDPTKPGVQKVLTFFLVNLERKIPSTSVIPPQQQARIDEVQEQALRKANLVDEAKSIVRGSFPLLTPCRWTKRERTA